MSTPYLNSQIEIHRQGEVAFVRVHGDLGTDEAQRLMPRLLSVAAPRPELAILELSAAESGRACFISPPTVRAISTSAAANLA